MQSPDWHLFRNSTGFYLTQMLGPPLPLPLQRLPLCPSLSQLRSHTFPIGSVNVASPFLPQDHCIGFALAFHAPFGSSQVAPSFQVRAQNWGFLCPSAELASHCRHSLTSFCCVFLVVLVMILCLLVFVFLIVSLYSLHLFYSQISIYPVTETV